MANHSSRLERPEVEEKKQLCINDNFLNKQLLAINHKNKTHWFVGFVNNLVAKVIPPELSYQWKRKFFTDLKHYYWEDIVLYLHYEDQIIRRCIPKDEMRPIL